MKVISCLLLFTIYTFSICSCSNSSSKQGESSIPKLFVIEFYEFEVKNEDTLLSIYLNREITKKEKLKLKINIYSKNDDAFAIIPLNYDSRQKKISIKLPVKDKELITAYPDLSPRGSFIKLIRNHINNIEIIDLIDFSMETEQFIGYDRFVGEERVYRYEDLIEFNPKLNYSKYQEFELWDETRLSNYSGKLDSKNRKQGRWIWKYGNGNKLAEAKFVDDSIQSPILFYYFTGELLDSISIEEYKNKKYYLNKTFYRNKRIKNDFNFRYKTKFGIKGEIISHEDWRVCDDLDLEILKHLTLKTLDGRDYLIKDSLETLIFKPDITQYRQCFSSSKVNGGDQFNFLPNDNVGPIQIKATMDSVFIELKFVNIDTSHLFKFAFSVKQNKNNQLGEN